MRGRNGTWHRYYYCRNHDPLRAGGEDRRCPERNIRADALDEYVFDQIRAAITQPAMLLAGEQAIAVTAPVPDDELLAAELARLDRKTGATTAERRRLADLYQAGLIDLPELHRRSAEVAARLRVSLISIAANASVTHLDRRALTREIRAALAIGVSPAEILEVCNMTSGVSVHSLTVGVPVIAELMREEAAAKQVGPAGHDAVSAEEL